MRKLTLIVALAFAIVVGITVTTIALAQGGETGSRPEPMPNPLEYLVLAFTDAYERDSLEAWLPGLLADIVVESYIAPETGETPEQVRGRLIAEFGMTPTAQPSLALAFDPDGPDRSCSDFSTWEEAQAFFWATENDAHGLDTDGDGVACETLPGAPSSEVQIQEVEIVVTATPTPTATPVPAELGTSRFSPWPMGDTCIGYDDDFCLGVRSVDWDAWPEIEAENQFNTAPPEGHTFVMVEVWLLNHSDSILWSGGVRIDLSVVGQGTNIGIRTFDNDGCGSIPDALPSQDVFQDGEVQGYLCFVVPDSDLDTLVMRYEYSYNNDEDLWYALR